MHNYGVRPLPGAYQLVDILMVMKDIAARPVDQPDVGIDPLLPFKLIVHSGIEQHVGDACHRNRLLHRIMTGGQTRSGKLSPGGTGQIG
ncbi:MAG: hypothetical protein K0R96_3657 [Pantoea agglomerans]|nr:hypothetical protein [Pantoea agglomerans]